MGWISELLRSRPSDRIADARGDKALRPSDVKKFEGISAECWLVKARQYINHNLENSPKGTFWIFEDFPVDIVQQIRNEYTNGGWIVTSEVGSKVMYFTRPT